MSVVVVMLLLVEVERVVLKEEGWCEVFSARASGNEGSFSGIISGEGRERVRIESVR